MRFGKARKSCGFMMESLEGRELLSSAIDGVVSTDPQPAADLAITADVTQPPLAAPTGVHISKTFSTSLIVGWTDQSASESGHRVERSRPHRQRARVHARERQSTPPRPPQHRHGEVAADGPGTHRVAQVGG